MTTTSPGTHEFPTKYIVAAIAAALVVAAVFAIAQWAGTESRQTVASPGEASIEVSTRVAEPTAGPNGLSEALAAGKLDAGLVPAPTESVAGSGFVSESVVISGQGGLHDALIAGKFGMEFTSEYPGVEYVRGAEAATTAGGLETALAAGKLDGGLSTSEPTAQSSLATTSKPTVSGGHQQ